MKIIIVENFGGTSHEVGDLHDVYDVYDLDVGVGNLMLIGILVMLVDIGGISRKLQTYKC